jgi:poly(3-hydroxybutyrate) depolymerase
MLVLFVCTLTWSQNLYAAGPAIGIASGPGSFSFVDKKGYPSKQITVYTYLPKGLKPDAARIVFVMHGVRRNAEGMRDTWVKHADKHGFMVVACECEAGGLLSQM